MLDHLAFDDGHAPHFAAAFSAALAGAYADAMERMTEALMGEGNPVRPAVQCGSEADAIMAEAWAPVERQMAARMAEAFMGGCKAGVLTSGDTDTKPAVAGLLAETPAGRYRGIGWCDATEAPPSPAPKPARRSFEVCQVLIPNMRVPIVIEDRPFSGHASPTDDSFADE